MGFEAYTVVLDPCEKLTVETGRVDAAVQRLVGDLQRQWPVIRLDEVEMYRRPCPLVQGEVRLVYETAQGLLQLLLTPSCGQVSVSVRFAYCNPRNIYQPFVEIITWLMENYKLNGYVMASDDLPDVTDSQEVESLLIPSMDYNRRLWQADAGTSEEAILRPVEAIKRFIVPRSQGASLTAA